MLRRVRFLLLMCVGLMVVGEAMAQRGRGYGRGRGPMARGGPVGDSSFAADRETFQFLLEHHQDIRRSVSQLENGVKTLTESDDPQIAAKLKEHVAAMYERVKETQPIRMRDPLFAEIFQHADKIDMQIEETEKGVVTIETSSEPRVVQLIQAHAKVVSDFVEHGFAEARKNHAVPPGSESPTPSPKSSLSQQQLSVLLAASADFDRLFIPALALTNDGKAKSAARAMERLWEGYPPIQQRVEEQLALPSGTKRDPVMTAITSAAQFVASKDLKRAHETLEPIRDMVTQRRSDLGIDYPLDTLNEYHSIMESIVQPAVSMTPVDVDESYLRRLRASAAAASKAWATVEQTHFSPELFPFDDQAAVSLDARLDQERAAITALNRALAQGDAATVLQAARGLKPPFAQVYKSFGDFEGLQPAARGSQD